MALSAIEHALRRALAATARLGTRRPGRVLLVAAALSLVAAFGASRLTLRADLSELLPERFPSVQGLETLKARFGGIGYVVVVGTGAEPEALTRFANDVASRVRAVPGIRWVEHERAAPFFEARALYYLDLDDLRTLADRLDERVRYERRRQNPMRVTLDDEGPPGYSDEELNALIEKYQSRPVARLGGLDVCQGPDCAAPSRSPTHYLDPVERRVVILCKPSSMSVDLAAARELLGQVRTALEGLSPADYGESFHWELTGSFQKKVDQQAQIGADLALSSIVALGLLALCLYVHFRSVVAVALVLAPALVGLTWTYGLTWWLFGSLNLLTGFLAAILGGLGIEHGIHLLTRYRSALAGGAAASEAAELAFGHTGTSAFTSAFVAAVTFASLGFSEFRAFHEFGVIAAVGMLVVLAATLSLMPALLALAGRLGWRGAPGHAGPRALSPLGRRLPGLRGVLGGAVLAATVLLSTFGTSVRFNTDFGALEDSRLRSFELDRAVNRILGYSQTPVVLFTRDAADEAALLTALAARKAALGPRSAVDFALGTTALVPAEQAEKRAVLDRMAKTLGRVSRDRLEPDVALDYDRLRTMVDAMPFDTGDLPESVRRQFRGLGDVGDDSGFVLVFPSISLSDGARVRDFAAEARGLTLPGGGRVSAAGEPMILADILAMVEREAPRILLGAVTAVLLAMWLLLGRLRTALLCMVPTALSLTALLGLLPIAGLDVNYLNILVFPVLIGVTVDAGVHLTERLSGAGRRFAEVYTETARSIVTGLLTSAVGFGAMVLADHPGLRSIGLLAGLGFAVNLLVVLVGFPAWWLFATHGRTDTSPQPTASQSGVRP